MNWQSLTANFPELTENKPDDFWGTILASKPLLVKYKGREYEGFAYQSEQGVRISCAAGCLDEWSFEDTEWMYKS